MEKKIPQTKVFERWSKWWYWNQNGKQVGPFDSRRIAFEECNVYLRRIQWDKKHERIREMDRTKNILS